MDTIQQQYRLRVELRPKNADFNGFSSQQQQFADILQQAANQKPKKFKINPILNIIGQILLFFQKLFDKEFKKTLKERERNINNALNGEVTPVSPKVILNFMKSEIEKIENMTPETRKQELSKTRENIKLYKESNNSNYKDMINTLQEREKLLNSGTTRLKTKIFYNSLVDIFEKSQKENSQNR